MQLEVQKYLFDIQSAANSIFEYTEGVTDFKEYQKSKLIKRAVERELEIIGEAMNRLIKVAPDLAINNSRRIVDLRNWIIHGYDKVDDLIIWGLLSKDLPLLKSQVDALLKN